MLEKNHIIIKQKCSGQFVKNIFYLFFIVESVDSYLSEKVDMIETKYPIITKPTDEVNKKFNFFKNQILIKIKIKHLSIR